MSKKKDIEALKVLARAFNKRLELLESEKPFEINVDNVSLENVKQLIELKKQQIGIYEKDLMENPQSHLSSSTIRARINNLFDELSRLYVIKSIIEKGDKNGDSKL